MMCSSTHQDWRAVCICYDSVLLSPKEKEAFIAEVRQKPRKIYCVDSFKRWKFFS